GGDRASPDLPTPDAVARQPRCCVRGTAERHEQHHKPYVVTPDIGQHGAQPSRRSSSAVYSFTSAASSWNSRGPQQLADGLHRLFSPELVRYVEFRARPTTEQGDLR